MGAGRADSMGLWDFFRRALIGLKFLYYWGLIIHSKAGPVFGINARAAEDGDGGGGCGGYRGGWVGGGGGWYIAAEATFGPQHWALNDLRKPQRGSIAGASQLR
jgi:hypothetical protein